MSEGWRNPTWPLITLYIIYFFIMCFDNHLNNLFNYCFPNWIIGDCDPNEEIQSYWKSLDENDLNWTIEEERQFRYLFKQDFGQEFKMYSCDTFKVMNDEKERRVTDGQPASTISNCHSYDILANPNYFDDFVYIPNY
jgi:hypothetical protein